jgi:hypothetical protein
VPTLFPADAFDRMTQDPRWNGHGYLGARANHLDTTDSEALPQYVREAEVRELDCRLIRLAVERGWTWEDLFAWADSRNGRWMADAIFGDSFDMWETAIGRWNLFENPND